MSTRLLLTWCQSSCLTLSSTGMSNVSDHAWFYFTFNLESAFSALHFCVPDVVVLLVCLALPGMLPAIPGPCELLRKLSSPQLCLPVS